MRYVAPMLATAGVIPASGDFVLETKIDGWRGLVAVIDGQVTIRSRNGMALEHRIPELQVLAGWRNDILLDGELVTLGADGQPDFAALSSRLGGRGRSPVSFVAFDLLVVGGEWVGDRPWSERRARLLDLDLPGPTVNVPPVFGLDSGLDQIIEQRKLEGIVVKRRSAKYRPGVRSKDWVKVKRWDDLAAVVLNVLPADARHLERIVGAPDPEGDWVTLGVVEHVAGGPTARRALRQKIASARRDGQRVVGRIRHQGWTANGLLRHPVWDAVAGTIPAD